MRSIESIHKKKTKVVFSLGGGDLNGRKIVLSRNFHALSLLLQTYI